MKRRFLFASTFFVLLFLAAAGLLVWSGMTDHVGKADIALVLGNMVSPSDSISSTRKEDEPIFTAMSRQNPDMQAAQAKAAATIPRFIEHTRSNVSGFRSVKLRFRDPDESERLGEDRFLFLWLTGVHYHAEEKLFSGTFFEVPHEFQKWHKVGDRLDFAPEDVFDWMMLTENGRLFGGYTLRVSRALLPESERNDYDKHIGVRVYEEEE